MINFGKTSGPKALRLVLAIVMLGVSMISLSSCRSGVNGEIYVLCYGDYFDQMILEDFEEETGIAVVLDTYDTAEELYTILSNSSAAYDCICTSDYMLEKLIKEGLLSELNKDNIPALKNIDPVYIEKTQEFDKGNKYTVPFQVGVSGIAYNKKMVKGDTIDSWDDLWNKKYEDQILMPDSVRDAFLIALLKNGYSPNSTNPDEILTAEKDLIKQKPLVYRYSNDAARDRLVDGSAALGVVWNGEYAYMSDLNEDIEFVVPKEGSEFFIDSWAIPTKATNKEGAEAWINFCCKKNVAAQNFDYLWYTCPNKAAYDLIDKEALENPSIFPTDEILERCHSLRDLPQDVVDIYAEAWKKFKAS